MLRFQLFFPKGENGKAAINCLIRVSFDLKIRIGGRAGRNKNVRVFSKKTYILPVGYLTCYAK